MVRAIKTWDALIKAVEVGDMAKANEIFFVGVVKKPVKPYFALMVDKIVSEELGIPRGEIRNDAQAMSILLKKGESSSIVLVDPFKINLGDPNAASTAEKILQRDFNAYVQYLKKLRHWVFYLNARDYVCRYEFFNSDKHPEDLMNMISGYALALASPSPRGDITSLHSLKRYEVVPSPITFADYEANEWGKKVAALLENHILNALKFALRR
jgi:hypothetical protein